MAIKHTCDGCGTAVLEDHRASVRMSVGRLHSGKSIPQYDGEMCPPCYAKIVAVLTAVLPPKKD